MRRDTLAATVGIVVSSVLAAAQAALVALLAGGGSATDGFFAAYALYLPVVTLGTSLHRGLVPILGSAYTVARRGGVSHVVTQMLAIAVLATTVLAITAVALTPALTHGLPSGGQSTAMATLLVLAPAGGLQIYSGTLAAVLSAEGSYPKSISMYIAGSAAAVTGSAGLIPVIGVIGAAIGLLIGTVVVAAGQTHLLARSGRPIRLTPACLRDVASVTRVAAKTVSSVSLQASQQLGFAVALAFVSTSTNAVTAYTYAFYVCGLVLNLSVMPLAILLVPRLVEQGDSDRHHPSRSEQTRVLDFGRRTQLVFAALCPVLAGVVVYGRPICDAIFDPTLSVGSGKQVYHLLVMLALWTLPAAVFALATSYVLAERRWWRTAWLGVLTVGLHFAGMYAASDGGPRAVAAAHAAMAAVSTLAVLFAVFGSRSLAAVLEIIKRGAVVVAACAVFPGIALLVGQPADPTEAIGVALGAGVVYMLLTAALLPNVVSQLLPRLSNPRSGHDV